VGELVLSHTVADAIAWLEEHRTRLCAALDSLNDGASYIIMNLRAPG